MISGLVAMPRRIFLTSGLPPRKDSSVMTASTLKMGTITPINSEEGPSLSSPHSDSATGRPNSA